MDTSLRVEIATSRSKTVVLVALGLVFVALGVWVILSAPEVATRIPRIGRFQPPGPGFVRVIGGVTIAVFGFFAAFSARRLSSPVPGLVLDARGLTDRTSIAPAGFVPWADVADLKTGELAGQPFLYVLLRDPAAFLKSVSPVKRTLMAQNAKLGPSPVALTAAALDMDFGEMEALVRAYWEAHARG